MPCLGFRVVVILLLFFPYADSSTGPNYAKIQRQSGRTVLISFEEKRWKSFFFRCRTRSFTFRVFFSIVKKKVFISLE